MSAREHLARIMHDANTGRITPDKSDPTKYGAMADAILAAGFRDAPEAADREGREGDWTNYEDEMLARQAGAERAIREIRAPAGSGELTPGQADYFRTLERMEISDEFRRNIQITKHELRVKNGPVVAINPSQSTSAAQIAAVASAMLDKRLGGDPGASFREVRQRVALYGLMVATWVLAIAAIVGSTGVYR